MIPADRWSRLLVALLLAGLCHPASGLRDARAQGVIPAAFSADILAERRAAVLAQHADGLVLIKANERLKEMEQPSWIQDPDFLYLTGLAEIPSAILVMDGPANRSLLFAPPAPRSFGMPLPDRDIRADSSVVARTGIPTILDWSHFTAYVEGRLRDGVRVLYTSAPRRPADRGTPDDMPAVAGRSEVWAGSLQQRFPSAELAAAAPTLVRLRWAKSPSEIAQLRLNADMSAHALREGMRATRPGKRQRELEGRVVFACLEAGATGPSFWPWMMAGHNAHIGRLVTSFLSYDGLDRAVEPGELLRADIGCMAGHYGGDVGRTVPVSGRFLPEQARIWDLLTGAYHAGVDAMAPGVSLDSVRAASRRYLEQEAARDRHLAPYAHSMLDPEAGVDWHIHGIGIESAESNMPVLEAGTVIAYEPMFIFGPDAFYLEDMILITATGADILTTDLPYTAEEMAAFLSGNQSNDQSGGDTSSN